jgi:hypothetical protein
VNLPLLRSAASAWLLLLAIMFTNGIVRVGLLQPRLGEEPARRLATLVGTAIVAAFAYAYARRQPSRTGRELLLVGAVWLALTLAFELGMGLATGRSWGEMLVDYDVARGRLWPLVLVATLLAPWAWGRRLRP